MDIKNIWGFVKGKTDKIQQDRVKYNEALTNSLRFDNFMRLDVKEKNFNEGRVNEILSMCPNLGIEKAKFVYNVIPIWEILLHISVIEEKVTGNKYYMICTNRWIWVINEHSYKIINYSEVYLIEIMKKSLLTQVINFNQVILNFFEYANNVSRFIRIVLNEEFRKTLIVDNSKYLSGITPTYQTLNKLQSGVSIDNNGNIVFHDRKKNNIRCVYDEILDYELLEDQTAVLKKKTEEQTHAITSTKVSCTTMSIRITFKDKRIFMMTILEPSPFNNQYNHNESIYMDNFKYGKSIIDLLESFNTKK